MTDVVITIVCLWCGWLGYAMGYSAGMDYYKRMRRRLDERKDGGP